MGFASSFDQRRVGYHPQVKIPVGERMASWALVTQYVKSGDIGWRPPPIQEMQVAGGKMIFKMTRYEVKDWSEEPKLKNGT